MKERQRPVRKMEKGTVGVTVPNLDPSFGAG
jgi:hypothetical protein